jgi:hypothetical protein
MIIINIFCCADSTIYPDTNLIFFSRKYCYCQVLHCCSYFYRGKNRSNVDCFLLSKCGFHVRPWNSSSINSFQVHRCWDWRFSILVIWYVHFCWVSNLITHSQSHFHKSYGELSLLLKLVYILGVSPSLVSRYCKVTVLGVFQDLKLKISEGSDQN